MGLTAVKELLCWYYSPSLGQIPTFSQSTAWFAAKYHKSPSEPAYTNYYHPALFYSVQLSSPFEFSLSVTASHKQTSPLSTCRTWLQTSIFKCQNQVYHSMPKRPFWIITANNDRFGYYNWIHTTGVLHRVSLNPSRPHQLPSRWQAPSLASP